MEEKKYCGVPGCSDCCSHEDESGFSLKKISAAAVVFAAAIAADHLSSVRLISVVLYLAAYLLCGKTVVIGALRNIMKGRVFDEQFLMTVASLAAVCLGQYPEAVAIMLFYQIGEYFQDYAVDRSRSSISALMNIRPDRAFVLRDGKTVQVEPSEVSVGELIIVKPGERVPLDGVIETGSSFVDTSALTGEGVPREVFIGSEVLSGFVNTSAVITIRTTKVYGESAVARILELTENASAAKARTEKFVTRFSRVYTPIVCLLALFTAVIPPLLFQAAWNTWIYRAVIFLVVSCPCALVISVPLSFFSGIGASSRCGILVKGSNYLETLAHVKTAVFDKTGTLTKGVFVVTAVHPADPSVVSADELVAVATHAEYYSNHPISKSLKTIHHAACCERAKIDRAEEISGQGLRVHLDGKMVLAGTRTLMEQESVTGFTECPENDTGTIVHIAIDGVYAGHIVISDEIKDDAPRALRSLKSLGIREIVMLTGDTESSAHRTAEQLGVDTVYAQLLPADKVSRTEELLARHNGPVLFVGDGVNDAPVLARSDVGVAMGALGSDAAVESADIVIMDDKPSRLADGILIARRTVRIVYENIIFALAVKAAIMVLGTFGAANMWEAVFGDVGVTFIAVLNSFRLLGFKSSLKKTERL